MTKTLPTLILAAGVAISAPACAAQVYRSGPPREVVYERGIERRAYDIGFREEIGRAHV